MMSTETNKVIVRRLWEEVWNQRHLSVCDEIFDAEYAAHEKGFAPVLLAAFPDLHFTIEDMIAEDDKVVTRHTL
ncbi:MAG: ester cyclase, partial [Caldilineaceae bacterium]|nr:ester cyclase [Caldilineaceae bacterium]